MGDEKSALPAPNVCCCCCWKGFIPVAVIVNGLLEAGTPCPKTGRLALLKLGERSNDDGNAGPGPVGVTDRFAYGFPPAKVEGGEVITGELI